MAHVTLSLYLYLRPCLAVSVSVPPSPSFRLCLAASVSLVLSVYLSLSMFLCLSVSVPPSLSVSHSLCLCLCPSQRFSLSVSLCVDLSLSSRSPFGPSSHAGSALSYVLEGPTSGDVVVIIQGMVNPLEIHDSLAARLVKEVSAGNIPKTTPKPKTTKRRCSISCAAPVLYWLPSGLSARDGSV